MKVQPAFKLSAAIALIIGTSVAFSTLMSACGPKNEASVASDSASSGGDAPTDPTLPTQGIIRAQRLAREAEVSCAEGAHCLEGVAMVVATGESGVTQCTGFLVAADRLVTSLRCVPADLRAEGANCSSRIRAYFPANERGHLAAVDAGCASLAVGAREQLAYIRLDAAVPRAELKISRDGLREASNVSIPVLIPTSSKKPIGEIRAQACRVVQGSAVLPEFRADRNPVALLGDCQAEETHLGAPVLDAKGAARAVVRAPFNGVSSFQSTYGSLLGGHSVPEFAYATNLACVRTPMDPPSMPVSGECSVRPATSLALDLARVQTPEVLASAHKDALKRLDKWRSQTIQYLGWTLSAPVVSKDPVMLPSPLCIAGSESWLEGYEHGWFRKSYDEKAEVTIEIPGYQAVFELNQYVQASYSIQDLPKRKVLITFSPAQLAKQGNSPVSVLWLDPQGRPGKSLLPRTLFHKCK